MNPFFKSSAASGASAGPAAPAGQTNSFNYPVIANGTSYNLKVYLHGAILPNTKTYHPHFIKMARNCRIAVGPPDTTGFTLANNTANKDLLSKLLGNSPRFCRGLNSHYLIDSINGAHGADMNCIFVTAIYGDPAHPREERLHSVATFNFIENDTIAYLDTVCAATKDYVYANGAWRLFKALYGLFNKVDELVAIRLESVNTMATLGFYKNQGFKETGYFNGSLIEEERPLRGKILKKIVRRAVSSVPSFPNTVLTVMKNDPKIMEKMIAEQAQKEIVVNETINQVVVNETKNQIVVNYKLKSAKILYFSYNKDGKTYTIYNVNDDDTYDIMGNDGTIIYNVELEELTIQERVEFNTTNMDSENCSDTIPNVPIVDGDILEGEIVEEEIVVEKQKNSNSKHKQRSTDRSDRTKTYKFPGGSRRKTKRNSKKRRRTQRRK